jgi:hypothetical protein
MISIPIKIKIIDLIKRGVSINNISKITKIGKSTIYYYYKKIRGRKNKLLNLNPSYTMKEGEIVGIFVGDGCHHFEKKGYHYFINVYFGIKNRDYLIYIKNLYESYFKKSFRIIIYQNKSVITTYSKEISEYFKNYIDFNPKIKHSTVKLKTLNLPIEFKIGFIKGLLDTDGCIFFNKSEKRKRIYFTTTSLELAKQTVCMLKEDFDVPCSMYTILSRYKNRKDTYNTYILSKGVDKFLNIFKPFKNKGL